MDVVVLAAGYGTRLYPLTLNKPKPLLSVNSKPIINYLIEKIEKLKEHFSIEETRIVSNGRFYKQFLNWKRKYGVEVKVLNDGSTSPQDRKGAVRDIKFAVGNKKSDCLVIAGDNLFEDDLLGFVKFSLKAKPYPCIGLFDVKRKKIATRFGVVKLNSKGRIVALKEKPKNPFSTLAATCIYFFPKESLKFLDLFLRSESSLDASGKYIEWLVKKSKVYGHMLRGAWVDIGHRDALKLAEEVFN